MTPDRAGGGGEDFRPDGPTGLRFLAHWFDKTRPGEDDEVQRDLRKWADE